MLDVISYNMPTGDRHETDSAYLFTNCGAACAPQGQVGAIYDKLTASSDPCRTL